MSRDDAQAAADAFQPPRAAAPGNPPETNAAGDDSVGASGMVSGKMPENASDEASGNTPGDASGYIRTNASEVAPDDASPPPPRITADMTLLDVVGRYRSTENVFRSRDARAGQCLLCTALFLTLDEAARRHDLDLSSLLRDLENAARRET